MLKRFLLLLQWQIRPQGAAMSWVAFQFAWKSPLARGFHDNAAPLDRICTSGRPRISLAFIARCTPAAEQHASLPLPLYAASVGMPSMSPLCCKPRAIIRWAFSSVMPHTSTLPTYLPCSSKHFKAWGTTPCRVTPAFTLITCASPVVS